MTPLEFKKLRMDLRNTIKKINELVKKERDLKETIAKAEGLCKHTWAQRVYRKETDDFIRVCTSCHKEKITAE